MKADVYFCGNLFQENMMRPYFFSGIYSVPMLVFAPLYGGIILYLFWVLSKNRGCSGLKKLLIILASLAGVLVTTPDLSPLMVKLAVFTTPFLVILFQRMGVMREGMRLFYGFMIFLGGVTVAIDLLYLLPGVDSFLYSAFLVSWAVLLHCALIAYCCWSCYVRYESVELGNSVEKFRNILLIMLIEVISAGAVKLAMLGGQCILFFIISFSSLVALQVVLLYLEYLHIFRKREYYVGDEGEDDPDHFLKDDECSEETAILLRLIQLFEREKLYLNPDITVAEVAVKIYTNRTYLSRSLNKRTNKNFSQFVNYYRIKEVCRLFIDTPDARMQQLSEQCGFNTGSSFASAFRLNTGYTPVEWGKEVRRKQANSGRVAVEDYIL